MEDESVIVSVCIPTYKHKKWLMRCVNSILSQQTNFYFEILIGVEFDDLETINFLPEIKQQKRYELKYLISSEEKLVYINGSRSGRGNFNNLLNSTNGKYIAICEGDDYWADPLKLQKQVDFLESNSEYVACYGGCKHVDENDNLIKKSRFTNYASPTSDLLLRAQGALITNSVMFRNVIDGFPSEFMYVPSGDTIIYHLLGFHGHGKFLPDIDYSAYRIHSGGIWSGTNEVKRMQNTTHTLSAIKTNLIRHFGEQSEHVIKMEEVYFNGVKVYLFNTIKNLEFNSYFKMLQVALTQNSFNKKNLLKNHLIDLFQRVFKKK
jgi:glycosyltransferase involved in cell wall biosynthesis